MDLITRGDLRTGIATQCHKDLTDSEDLASVDVWIRQALARLVTVSDWFWLRKYLEITLVADQKAYALPVDFARIQADSLAYGDYGRICYRESPELIDRDIGPSWKRSSASSSTPTHATILGDDDPGSNDGDDTGAELWLGPPPSLAFVAQYSSLDLYYFRVMDPVRAAGTDLADADRLLVPSWMEPFAIRAGAIFGLQEDDDNVFQTALQQFEKDDIPKMRGFDVSIHSEEPLQRPILPRRRGRRSGYSYGR